ncbi:MAG: DUF2784 family protein [Acidobacteriota bacterium]|nr:DUF2784 family protein [Acidobacteriota bacterium]
MSDFYLLLAGFVLLLHFLFNVWVVGGAFVTNGRPTLERLHILSLFYGVVIENVAWPCPLTVAQKWFLMKAGTVPYQGDFILHYLRVVVAPDFPLALLRWGAIGVFLVNMAVYARRYARTHHHAFHH